MILRTILSPGHLHLCHRGRIPHQAASHCLSHTKTDGCTKNLPETIIRPTRKFVTAGYIAVLLVIISLAYAVMSLDWPPLAAWLSPILLIWPLKSDIQNRMSRLTILEDKLRFDVGLLSRTTRTVLIPRIQDVTVHQTVVQRILGVGDLTIETAGESGRLSVARIDRPQEVADMINDLSRKLD
jgi:uncharacterized membrane protein YdbT with pleckstrin-like domain